MRRIGVCSWSLCAAGPDELVKLVRACGLDAVQLALDPVRERAWSEAETVDRLREAGIDLISGMMGMAGEDYTTLDSIRLTGGVRADQYWPANLKAAVGNAALARRLGVSLVTLHAGFLPHDASGGLRRTMVDRLRQVAAAFADQGIEIGLETGQESDRTLLEMLDELAAPNIGINFDPGNMILYATGEPVRALRVLHPRVRQIHIKDATPSTLPGAWGQEEVAGRGAVDWPGLFEVVQAHLPDVNLVIEREAGDSRVEDVRTAEQLIRRHLGS